MSQHRWTTTDGWDVLTGWDRPLHYFFLQVSQPCACLDIDQDDDPECTLCNGEAEIYAYENMRDPELRMGAMSLAQVQRKLAATVSNWPAEIFANLTSDQVNNIGNAITEYPAVGERLA